MNGTFTQFALGTIALAIAQIAQAQVDIQHIIPMKLPNAGTEIRVVFNGLPPEPQAYQLEQPSRLILDFNKTNNKVSNTQIPISGEEASSVEVISDAQRSRLTVNLLQAGDFTTRVEGNTFVLKINPKASNSTLTNLNGVAPVALAAPQQGITNINFQRGSQGEGQVVIDLAGQNTPVDVQQQGSKILVRSIGQKIPTHLVRRLNVNDFATPVSAVDAMNDQNAGTIAIQTTGSYEYMAYQTDNKLTISALYTTNFTEPLSYQDSAFLKLPKFP